MRRWIVIWGAVIVGVGILAAVLFTRSRIPRTNFLTGAVLRQDVDPRKEQPIAGAEITAAAGEGRARSDAAGLFRLQLARPVPFGQKLPLLIRHGDYQPLKITVPAGDELLVLRLVPSRAELPAPGNGPQVRLSDVRVRYAVKSTQIVNIGSAVKTFEVVNTGNVPCGGVPPCSPDRKWRATIGSASLDAGDSNEFRNARLSCIAGPCAFTRIESENLAQAGRTINVSVRNWSDTTTFLIEAEVVHTMQSDLVRLTYPAIFGRGMNFTLPATSLGTAILADLNGQEIVFPLGPRLELSWAACTFSLAPDRTQVYRCQLKPGYRFQ